MADRTPRMRIDDSGEHGDRSIVAIDRKHLARQTMGDSALQREILGLFADQIEAMPAAFRDGNAAGRGRLAHTLKGSARGVGAFALAALAEEVEAAPGDAAVIERLCAAIGEMGAALRRGSDEQSQ